jgi:deoxyribonuclease-4
VSSAGGVPEAPARAAAIHATAMQLFTKMANRWAERECVDDECRMFRERLAGTAVTATMAHDSYLINLASPDPVLRARSIESFVSELRRCGALGLHYLVSHPGNFMDEREAGIARNADAIIGRSSAQSSSWSALWMRWPASASSSRAGSLCV